MSYVALELLVVTLRALMMAPNALTVASASVVLILRVLRWSTSGRTTAQKLRPASIRPGGYKAHVVEACSSGARNQKDDRPLIIFGADTVLSCLLRHCCFATACRACCATVASPLFVMPAAPLLLRHCLLCLLRHCCFATVCHAAVCCCCFATVCHAAVCCCCCVWLTGCCDE